MDKVIKILKQELACVSKECGRESTSNSICSNCDLALSSVENIKEALGMAIKALEQELTNKDLTCAYAKGVYDTREETATIIDKIKADVLDNAFSVVNPKNTYEYINVLDLDSIEKILDKYKADSEPQESEARNE